MTVYYVATFMAGYDTCTGYIGDALIFSSTMNLFVKQWSLNNKWVHFLYCFLINSEDIIYCDIMTLILS